MFNDLLPGQSFVRMAIAKALHPESEKDALEYSVMRWGASSNVATILRAAVGGTEYGADPLWTELGKAATAFVEEVRPRTILGKLQGLRRVPGMVPFVKQTGLSTGYWVSQGSAVPLTKAAFTYDTISPMKVAAMSVFSNELLKSTNPASEEIIRKDLISAMATVADSAFIDPLNDGVAGKTPASITYGVGTITASGDISNDLELAIANFNGDLTTASWLMSPRLAVQIGLRAGVSGVACDLGARGGMLAGIPAITSTAVNYEDSDGGQLVLVDAGGIVLLDDGVARVKISQHATVEMDDAPTGEILTPTSASTAHVNMFQTESAAILAVREVNWEVVRDNAVVILAGANYPS